MSVIAVIGSKGRMGAMLCKHWEAAGHQVRGVDSSDTPASTQCTSNAGTPANDNNTRKLAATSSNATAIGNTTTPKSNSPTILASNSDNTTALLHKAIVGADIVALCIPAPAIAAVLSQISLSPQQILMDITSVKVLPMQQMQAHHNGPVVGTHPLFGPAPQPEDLSVALTPGLHATLEHSDRVASLFTCFGCRIFQTTPEEHDRGVAYVQGLNFISSAAYFASLAHREDVLPFLTPSFRRRLESARKLLTEDAGMFEDFTNANPMTKDAVHTFRLFLDLIESGGLNEVTARARTWF